MGFLFVDHIEALDEHGARGALDVATRGTELPPWLVLEAVGQLAAWVAMARTGFASRPVAALVGEAILDPSITCVRTDQAVVLEARLERIDGRAILYSGSATCGGRVLARLARCVGPLLPVALFDDPDAVAARLATLRGGGGTPPHDPPPTCPIATDIEVDPAGGRRARLTVPATAPYFADHFPRRPVFPATLLAAALDALAAPGAAAALGVSTARVVAVRAVGTPSAAAAPGAASASSAAASSVAGNTGRRGK